MRPRRSPERGGSITFTLLVSAKGGGGGRAEREVQSEEGLRFLEYWRHENPRDCI